MKGLTIHHTSHSPLNPATASTTVAAAINLSSFSPRPNFPVFPQPYALLFHSLRTRLSTKPSWKSSLYSSSSLHRMATTTAAEGTAPSSRTVIKLNPIEATPQSFQEFGQVIEASPDGDEFGPHDAQLDLSRGIPRFYIMRLEDRALKFSTITHHANVTQCLGSIGGHVWYLGVAKPSIVDPSETKGTNAVQSHCGHFYIPPAVEDVRVFKISGPKFLKLNLGTWHAGPLFRGKDMDFYNLELSNTNVADHTTHSFVKKNNVVFSFDE